MKDFMKNTYYTNIFSQTWLHAVLIALGALLAYYSAFQVPFVFDDIRQIVENPFIRSLNNFLTWDILQKNRPFVDLTFALNYHFGGLQVYGYHLVNLIIHILNGLLVYCLVFMVMERLVAISNTGCDINELRFYRWVALFTALIFILHPLQTQAVTYIVQRYTSLAATFYLLSVICYILARKKQLFLKSFSSVFFFFFLSFIFGILAFLSKQSAASLPITIVLTEFLLFDRTLSGWRKKLYWIVPSLSLLILFFFYNVGFFSGKRQLGSLLEDVSVLMRETEDISRWHYLLTQFNVIPKYLFQFIVPIGQNADPMFPVTKSFWEGLTPLGFVFLVLLLGAGVYFLKRIPVFSFAVFWFFITLSVESSIIPIKDTMFEHRMYLPLLGPAILVAWFATIAAKRYFYPTLVFSLSFLILFGFLTYHRNQLWQDEVALWTDSIRKNPNNYRAHTSLALSFESQNEKNKAFYHYNKALHLNSDYAYAHLNFGAFYGEQGQLDQAEYHFRQAMKELPDNPKILSNLGVVLAQQGDFDNALELFEKAIQLDRYHIEARINLTITLLNLQKVDQAKNEIKKILELSPDNVHAIKLLDVIK